MSGLFARLATRIVGDPPGLASPRVPTRFEPLPEEVGLVEPQAATIAGDAAPQADGSGAQGARATATVPGTSISTFIPSNAAGTSHFQPAAAAHAAAPAGRRGDIAEVPHAALAATALSVGEPAAVQRRAADLPAMPGSGATPTAIAATSRTADAEVGKQPSTAPTAASASTGAPASKPETERGAAIDVERSRPAIEPTFETVRGTAIDVERSRPAIEPTPARGAAPAPGRPIPFAPNAIRPQPRVPQTAHLASAADASQSMPGVPPIAPATGPIQAQVFGIEPASAPHGSPSPKLEARRPASYTASPTPVPRVPAPASAAPIVEVHIGSVEIRAAPQPAPPAAPAGPAARSLDDFLVGRHRR